MQFQKIVRDIYLLKTPTSGVWSGIVFVDGKEKILIDSSESGQNIDKMLIPALAEMGYSLAEINWLCNTHCHGDHVGGHKRIVELAHPKVAAYTKSVPKLKDPLFYSKKIRAVWPAFSPPAPAVLDGVDTDVILREGDLIGERLELISTPGHDDDCVCFLDHETGTLISGDSLQGNGTSSQGTALFMYLPEYLNTLEKLSEFEIENIVSAHPFLMSGAYALGKQASKEYIENCRKVTEIYDDFIRDQLKKGIEDEVTIAKNLIHFMNNKMPQWLFLPLYTVRSYKNEIQNFQHTGD